MLETKSADGTGHHWYHGDTYFLKTKPTLATDQPRPPAPHTTLNKEKAKSRSVQVMDQDENTSPASWDPQTSPTPPKGTPLGRTAALRGLHWGLKIPDIEEPSASPGLSGLRHISFPSPPDSPGGPDTDAALPKGILPGLGE